MSRKYLTPIVLPADPTNPLEAATKQYVDTKTSGPSGVANEPVGSITAWPTASAPSGYLLCDGGAYSRTTYAELFAVIGTTYGTGGTELLSANQASFETDVTAWGFSNAFGTYGNGTSKAQSTVRAVAGTRSLLATWSTHTNGDWMQTSVTVVAGTTYRISVWVYVPSGSPDVQLTDTFNFNGPYTTVKDAWTELVYDWTATGTNLNFGIHCQRASVGTTQCWIDKASVTSTSTTVFQVPDLRDRAVVGTSATKTVGTKGGSETHTLTTAEMPVHQHEATSKSFLQGDPVPGGAGGSYDSAVTAASTVTAATGGGIAHNNVSPYTALNFIIKYTKQVAGTDTLEWIDLALVNDWVVPTGSVQTTMPFTWVYGQSGITVNGAGQMVVTKAGIYHVAANLQISNNAASYVVFTLKHRRSGAVLTTRESVGYSANNAWDSVGVVGDFSAQVGDIFEMTAETPTGSNVIQSGRSQFTAHRLAGAGPPGPQGPMGPTATIDDTGWIPVIFNTGWNNYAVPSFPACAYRRRGGVVYLTGLAQRSSGSATLIFGLPVGFRPLNAGQSHVTVPMNGLFGIINISPSDGGVYVNTGNPIWCSLDNVSFIAV